MIAQDVMTRDVATVSPSTPVHDIAKLMAERRIGGVPVVDQAGRLAGIVTDVDLYRRAELGTEKQRTSLLELLFRRHPGADAYVEAHGRTARDVMTPDVVAVAPSTTLRQVADLFERKRFRRVPVVADEGIVGIVSRADLVRALASMPPLSEQGRLADQRIRDRIMAEFKQTPWGLRAEGSVIVNDGVAHLWGFVQSDDKRDALRIAAEAVPGVKGVEDHTIRFLGDMAGRSRVASAVTVVGPEGAYAVGSTCEGIAAGR